MKYYYNIKYDKKVLSLCCLVLSHVVRCCLMLSNVVLKTALF